MPVRLNRILEYHARHADTRARTGPPRRPVCQKSDEELEKIARSGDQFTPAAEQALNAEVTRRKLNLVLTRGDETPAEESQEPEDVVEFDRTVTLRRYRDLPDALLAKGSLESAGIRAYVIDDNMVRMDWFISNAIGGMRLQVHEEDQETAEAILSQPIPEVLQVEGGEPYQQPACPKCGSLDVSYRDLLRAVFTGEDRVAWTCRKCEHRWEGDSDGIPRAATG